MPELACVNGEFSSIDDARVPINDRGLLFGDSVYEVFVGVEGRLWCADAHMARLERSLTAIAITADVAQIRRWVAEAVIQSGLDDCLVYVQVTRGVADRNHLPAPDMNPTVIVTVRARRMPSATAREEGIIVTLVDETRWARRDIKSTNLLPNVLAKLAAAKAGAYEALFVAPDGEVNEGSSTNVFLVKNEKLVTPELGPHILPGITRQTVLGAASRIDVSYDERKLTRDQLLDADEAFISSSTSDILGIVRVDETPIGSGKVGPITARLYDEYLATVRRSGVTPQELMAENHTPR